jgi:hypothetical protein
MSNNYWDEDEDDDTTTETETFNGDGSDLLKKLRKAKRSDEKRIKELTEQLEGYSKKQREAIVKEVLEKQGVNPKAARLALKDIEDVTEESVNNWLDDNGDLFGYVAKGAPGNEDLAALRRQDSSVQGANAPDRGQDLEMRIANAKSEDELRAILNSQ